VYQIDKNSNRINLLEKKKFSELGFTERGNLQEWLAHEPTALGEDLLIIQKEFDGFDDTYERLDLLALDRDANLVVIENKLDDSGRDVVWQALKYASYCSTLTKPQIVEMYQKYLDKWNPGKVAQTMICDFLNEPDIGEVVINKDNQQRLILVAAKFRKEVTSTVLWLLGHNISLKCFKVTPYAMCDYLFLNLEQIIPTPEAAEYMIGISQKETEVKTSEKEAKDRHRIRQDFWLKALDAFRLSQTTLFNNISPSKDHWLSAGSGISGCPYNLIFGNKKIRVEVQITCGGKAENKYFFDQLHARKSDVEIKFGDDLSWERLEDKISCYIRYEKSVDGDNRDNWPDMINWLVDHMIRLEAAFKKELIDAYQALKKAESEGAVSLDGESTCSEPIG
jgi:hypothetical protein